MSTETNQNPAEGKTEGEGQQVDLAALQKQLSDYEATVGSNKRTIKDLQKEIDELKKPKETLQTKDSTDLDYGQKAFLKASGINGSDELALVKEFARRTGDSLDAIVEDDIFKAKLDRLRTTKENALAAESKGRGNTSTGRDSADYWLAKLGPNDPVPADLPRELREKVVAARRSQGKTTKMFYNE